MKQVLSKIEYVKYAKAVTSYRDSKNFDSLLGIFDEIFSDKPESKSILKGTLQVSTSVNKVVGRRWSQFTLCSFRCLVRSRLFLK